jgi:6-pyruvoyltetrahydropterin/6-carboxytetrahydropterin synthase
MHENGDILRVTKTFSFEMAHALNNYDGDCKNIHGHSYKLAVTVSGNVSKILQSPKEGMVIDFKHIKDVVKEILSDYDHSLQLNEAMKSLVNETFLSQFKNTRFVAFQPTCENILLEIKNRIHERIGKSVKLVSVRLDETATSYAEWLVSDNVKQYVH